MNTWPLGGLDPLLTSLQQTYAPHRENVDIAGLLTDDALGSIALVSSFGSESATLLHFVTRILPSIPVLFLDTGKHFPETLDYRDQLVEVLDLNIRIVRPDEQQLSGEDPYGTLHSRDPNACCTIRKTFPLQDALAPFDSWISGRKRYQGGERTALPIIERDGHLLKVNPMALWTKEDVDAYYLRHNLPRHPLVSKGYPSIGCAPCTRAVETGEDARAGRWPQMPDKMECGIHLGPDGRVVRTSQTGSSERE